MSYKCEHGKDSDVCVQCYEDTQAWKHYDERERLKQSEFCKHEYTENSTVCTKCGT